MVIDTKILTMLRWVLALSWLPLTAVVGFAAWRSQWTVAIFTGIVDACWIVVLAQMFGIVVHIRRGG